MLIMKRRRAAEQHTMHREVGDRQEVYHGQLFAMVLRQQLNGLQRLRPCAGDLVDDQLQLGRVSVRTPVRTQSRRGAC